MNKLICDTCENCLIKVFGKITGKRLETKTCLIDKRMVFDWGVDSPSLIIPITECNKYIQSEIN